MNLYDLTKELRGMSDEELQEELAKLRAARRMRPEKKKGGGKTGGKKKTKEPTVISADII